MLAEHVLSTSTCLLILGLIVLAIVGWLVVCSRPYSIRKDGRTGRTLDCPAAEVVEPAPIPMLLVCPVCGQRHIDKGEFATKPHHSHACQKCGNVWRPALVHTVGVEFLPGFKTE